MVSGALVCHAECGASVRPCKDLCIPRCIHTHTHLSPPSVYTQACHHLVCAHTQSPPAHTRALPPSGTAEQKSDVPTRKKSLPSDNGSDR